MSLPAHISQQASWLEQALSRMATAHGAGQASIRQGLAWSMRSTAHGAAQASIRLDLAWLLSWTAPGAMLESTSRGLAWLLSSTAHGVRQESTRLAQVRNWSSSCVVCRFWLLECIITEEAVASSVRFFLSFFVLIYIRPTNIDLIYLIDSVDLNVSPLFRYFRP